MKYSNRIIAAVVLVFSTALLVGCEKTATSDFTDSAILQSYLQPNDTFKLQVGRQFPFDTTVSFSADDINNLSITLHYNNVNYTLTPAGNGLYTNSAIQLQEGDNYSVEFTFNSKTVSAASYIPTKPANFNLSDSVISVERQLENTQGAVNASAPINFTWTNNDGSYYFIMVENLESSLDPIAPISADRPPKGFRKIPVNGNFDELRGGDFTYYGRHRVVLFHVLSDYAALYQQNNTSSQNLTNASSSIINGYGIFTGINSDTLYISVKPL